MSDNIHAAYCFDCSPDTMDKLIRDARTVEDSIYVFSLVLDHSSIESDTSELVFITDTLILLNARTDIIKTRRYELYRDGILLYKRDEKINGIEKIKEAIAESDKERKIHGSAGWLSQIRILYNEVGMQEEKYLYYKEKLKHYQENGPVENTGACYHGIAGYYSYKADYNNAINYYLKAADVFKHFTPFGYANGIAVVGSVYKTWGNFERAQYYLKRGYELNLKVHNWGNAMFIKRALGLIEKSQKNYYAALKNIEDMFGLFRKDTLAYPFKAMAMVEKAGILLEMNRENEAYSLLMDAKKFSDSLGLMMVNTSGEIETEFYLFKYYLIKKDYPNAEKQLVNAYNKASELKVDGLKLKYGKELTSFYVAKGDFRKGVSFAQGYIHNKDSLRDIQNGYNIAEYEKEQEKLRNNEELATLETQKKQQRNYFLIGGVFLLLLSISIFSRLQFIRKVKRQLEEKNKQIEKEKSRAEQSEKFKQQFLANMSHEIRTPMNAVMGMTNLLIDKNPRTDQENYLNGIKNSSDTLLHIINDILDLSKIEAGKIELEQIDFSLLELTGQVKQTLNYKAEEKGIHLIADIHPEIPEVLIGDPVRLSQVLMNLAGNAIKFTEKGSVMIEASATAEGRVKFAIVDTGIGIPKDKLQSVFDSFSQAHLSDTRKFGGTGLGLSISKQLVELMGGIISVESQEGAGTTFSFEIGLPAGSKERLRTQKSPEQIDGSILNGLRILVVDDNEYNRTVAHDTLKSKARVEITEAPNGKEAVELLESKGFDIVLMDVQMPVMDGYEATRYIREKLAGPKNKIPVIALTASVVRSDLDKCRAAGMNDYVPKPFRVSQLISAIAKATGRELKFAEDKAPELKKNVSKLSRVTDLSYLEKFCGGDQKQMQKYIAMFTATAPDLIEKINKALANHDFEEIATQIHGFKTRWIMMGMKESKDLALRIEQDCRKEIPGAAITANITLLMEQITAATSELKQF